MLLLTLKIVTLRGVEVSALKKNEEVVESLGERILGRVALDVVNPLTNEVLVSRTQITEVNMKAIDASPIESRSSFPLVCEA
jgi:DNA-directed RNA polymerase subunit beta'